MKTKYQNTNRIRLSVRNASVSLASKVLAVALLSLSTAGRSILTAANNSRDQEAVPRLVQPPASTETNSSVVRQIGIEKLVGTLEVNLPLSQNVSHEWYFVDGHLLGALPIQTKFRLLPGRYEERLVAPYDGGFWVAKRARSIARNDTNAIPNSVGWTNITVRATLALPWSQTVYRLDCRSLEDAEKQLARIEEEENDKWDAFAQGDLWTPIAEAVAYNRLTRRNLWMDLPLALGGPREIDPGQLESLRDYFSNHLPSNDFTVETPFLSGAQQEAAVKAAHNLVEAGRKQLSRNFDQTFAQLKRNLSRQVGSLAQTSK